MAEVKTQLFDRCQPLVLTGNSVKISVDQSLKQAGVDLLDTTIPNTVEIRVDGPRLQLTPADIAGVYPAPGSEESPDEFLPHIALNRRTLPWERPGPNLGPSPQPVPWLALLLVKESELRNTRARTLSAAATLEHLKVKEVAARDPMTYTQFRNVLKLGDNTDAHMIFVPNTTLKAILPKPNELHLLCHMKRVITRESHTPDVSKDTAIVISNRLPNAAGAEPELHTALLVSMERREDLYNPVRFNADIGKSTALIVLHHWTFTPSKGGDFEQVIQAISIRPNGGVLRFGNRPAPARAGNMGPLSGGFDALLDDDGYPRDPLSHTQTGNVVYRGPLRPFPSPARSKGFAIRSAPEEFDVEPDTPLDYSHAAAFEIGRLLALNDPGILDDLHEVHMAKDPIESFVAVSKMPPALQKPDWVSNPEWFEKPWSMTPSQSLIKGEGELLGTVGRADITGIEEQLGSIKDTLIQQLRQLSTPAPPLVVQVDIHTATSESLTKQFADVFNAGLS